MKRNNKLGSISVALSLALVLPTSAVSAPVDCSALFIPVTQQSQSGDEPECADPGGEPLKGYAKGLSCKLQVGYVHPTQPAVGMTAVNCKRDKLVAKSETKLDHYLQKGSRVVPTVIGPDGNYYITDHHHLSTAVYKTLQEKPDEQAGIRLYAEIVGNFFTDQSGAAGPAEMKAFWDTMTACNNAYLEYQGSPVDPMNPQQMPEALASMRDDPYRTLSRWVRDADGYIKPSEHPANFLEFTWADKLRLDLGKSFPLCAIDARVGSPACQQQIQQVRASLDQAMESARAYDSVSWIQEGNCAKDLQGDPAALAACGYNPDLIVVDVGKYITADRGCETSDDYQWTPATAGVLPGDGLSWFQYAQGHATESYTLCRAEQDGLLYSGSVDPASGRCVFVDDDDRVSSASKLEVLTGVQGMYLWSPYTEEISESGDKFFDDAIPVGNSKDSDLGETYVCAAGSHVGWVKKDKQKCHLDADGLHVPFAVLTED